MCGTLTNTTTSVLTGSATWRGSVANPVTTTSALSISATGVGIAVFADTNPPLSANNGTHIADGMNGYFAAGNVGCMSMQTTTGSWTPSFNASLQTASGIEAVMWG
jgi:hypothetical protein